MAAVQGDAGILEPVTEYKSRRVEHCAIRLWKNIKLAAIGIEADPGAMPWRTARLAVLDAATIRWLAGEVQSGRCPCGIHCLTQALTVFCCDPHGKSRVTREKGRRSHSATAPCRSLDGVG
jgi:hypothetical protein